jgi:hypothetical protein
MQLRRQNNLRFLKVTFGGADYGPFYAVFKEKLSNTCAKMAFARVCFGFFIAQFFSFFQKPTRAMLKERFYKSILVWMKSFPDFFKRSLISVADNYAAACAAENIAERVDMDTLGR